MWLRKRRRWAALGQLLQEPGHCAVWQGLTRKNGVLHRTTFFNGRYKLPRRNVGLRAVPAAG